MPVRRFCESTYFTLPRITISAMAANQGTADGAYFRLFMKPELIAKSDRVQISHAPICIAVVLFLTYDDRNS